MYLLIYTEGSFSCLVEKSEFQSVMAGLKWEKENDTM